MNQTLDTDLVCLGPGCDKRFVARKWLYETEAAARFLGWSVWSGETMSGKHVDVVLCPGCSKGDDVRPARRSRSKPTDYDVPMF